MQIGLGLGIGTGAPGVAVPNPLTLAAKNGATLDMWCRTDLGILLHADMPQRAGTFIAGSPTLSGSTATVQNIVLETNDVSGGTATGQTKFRYGVDGVSWIQTGVTTALGPIALQGALSGAFLSFPTATTWANDCRWVAAVSGWQDQTGNGNDFINSDYTISPFLDSSGSFSNIPSIRSGPASPDPSLKRYLTNTSLPPLTTGTDVSWTLWIDFQVMNTAAGGMLWNWGLSSQAAKDFHEQQYGGTNQLLFNRVDNASVLRQRYTAVGFTDQNQHYHQNVFSGTDLVVKQDGVTVSLPNFTGAANLDVGALTFDLLTLFARKGSTTTNYIDARINEIAFMRGSASAGMQTDMQAYMALGAARFV